MIPLDNLERITAKMRESNATDILTENEKEQWEQLPEEEKIEALKNIISYPVGHNLKHWVVFNWFLKTRWVEALQAVNLVAPISALELATGSNDKIPQILTKRFNHTNTRYTTVNLNKKLTADFKQNTKDLALRIDIIEDAAQNIENYFSDEKADVVIFEHAFNDIAEDLIAKKHGIDTINIDWFDIIQRLIEITNKAYLNGTYEEILKENFLEMLSSSLKVLKPGSFIISHQFQYQFDIDRGIFPEIWTELISMVRKWINEKDTGEEVFFDGFDPTWWMFIKKA